MKNFCHNAFTGLDISPAGNIKPCCKFLNDKIPVFYIKDGITSYKDSEFLKDLQDQFLQDQRPAGCSRCWTEEDAGMKSKRQLDYIRHKTHFDLLKTDNSKFTNISIAFGNICNFSCRICGPASSSRWVSEMSRHSNISNPVHIWYKDKKVMDDIFNHTKNAVHFDIPGGEPLLVEIDEHFDFLGRFDSEKSKDISLHYTTNGSVFPKKEFLDVWRCFKEVDIQLSIDDTGQRFEYNRWPGEWDDVFANIKSFQKLERENKNIRLSISFTVSVFTIYYADEFYHWCKNENLPDPWMGRLNAPVHYRAGVLGEETNKKIREKLSRSKFLEVQKLTSYVDDTDHQHYAQFKEATTQLDNIRNQKFHKIFPELSQIAQ
jgi:sulfatase maturation enzyme AslB (radical SAM superfamily)